MVATLTLQARAGEIDGLVRAIHKVETSGRVGTIRGDGGRALGPLQIHKINWLDVKDKIGGRYENCADLNYSTSVFKAYCLKYEPKAYKSNNFEVLARLWNSGPNWRAKINKTDGYWRKVKANLN